MIYVLVFAGLVALRIIASELERLRRPLYWIIILGLFFFSAFRFEVGCDWIGYLNQYFVYGRVPLSEVFEEREPVWVAVFSIQQSIGLPYPWINVVSSLVFFIGAHAMARRQPDPLAFLILLFPILILNMPMSGIRQGAAIGVMFFAFNAFIDRKLVKYVLLVLLAAAIHESALIFLLLSPVVTGQFSRTQLAWGGLLAVPGILLLLNTSGAELANTRYLEADTDAAGAVFRTSLVAIGAAYFLFFVRQRWLSVSPNDFKLVFLGSIASLAVLALLPLSTVIADRLAYYLVPVQAMIFSRLPYVMSGRGRVFHIALPYALLITALGVWISYSSLAELCYDPYQSWLFGYPHRNFTVS